MNKIPRHACVVLVGVALSGKSTWAHEHFNSQEILCVAQLRAELTGNSRNFTQDRWVWQELYHRAHVRLRMGQRVVIDSTNLKREDLNHWSAVCVELGVPIQFVHMHTPELELLERARAQGVAEHVIRKQQVMLNQTLQSIRHVKHIQSSWFTPDQVEVVSSDQVLPDQLLVVGDVHGDASAMQWVINLAHTQNRHLVWLGDVVDYGAQNLACVDMAYESVSNGEAHMIWGNHERKIDRWIHADWGTRYQGRLSDANWMTVREIEQLSVTQNQKFASKWCALSNWSTQHVTRGAWMMTHGAAHPSMWHTHSHRLSGEAGNMAFFGEVHDVQPTRADGYPNRTWRWVDEVPTGHTVVVGHDYLDRVNHAPVIKQNAHGGRVICLDTGNSKGGTLSVMAVDTNSQEFEILQYSATG
jgi:protein phosphatase